MGLAEKRVIVECQSQLEDWKKKIEAVCGKSLNFDMDWNNLVKEGSADRYPATMDSNLYEPLEKALKSVCSDQSGKDAFCGAIDTVKVTSNRDSSSLEVKVDGKILHLDTDPTYGTSEFFLSDYPDLITTELEASL